MSRGQSLVELAVCAPVALTLVLVAMAAVEVESAQSGLDAATQAAAAAAARAPNPGAASAAAQSRFGGVLSAYAVIDPQLALDLADLGRNGQVTANGTALVAVGPPGLGTVPATLRLHSHAVANIEPWRSHW